MMAFIIFASCKKTSTTNRTTTATPPATTSTTYSLSFLDGSTNTTYTWTNWTMQYLTAYPTNANANYGTWVPIPPVGSNHGWLYLVTPLDSSNMYKLAINTNYNIHYYNYNTGQSIPDSDIGSLSFMMSTTSSGTDSTVNQTQTTTYYNKITSVTYIGRVYDTNNSVMTAQYVIKGVFNALVKNDVSNLTRVLSNGQYSFLIEVRTH